MFPFIRKHSILTHIEAVRLWKAHIHDTDPFIEVPKLRRHYEVWYERYGILSEIMDQDRSKVLDVFEYYLRQEGVIPD